jgi:hypothetical protein
VWFLKQVQSLNTTLKHFSSLSLFSSSFLFSPTRHSALFGPTLPPLLFFIFWPVHVAVGRRPNSTANPLSLLTFSLFFPPSSPFRIPASPSSSRANRYCRPTSPSLSLSPTGGTHCQGHPQPPAAHIPWPWPTRVASPRRHPLSSAASPPVTLPHRAPPPSMVVGHRPRPTALHAPSTSPLHL